ncbi:MAG: YraN family protein [Pseudobdellovibrionaceae bacterium]|nr:YraN family protein [Pseudobdellovibrionaceae bacterium]
MKSKFLGTYQKGILAEIYAAFYLVFLKNFRMRSWRYKTPVGEIDLVMRSGNTIIFVEVKCRPSRDEGVSCVTQKMQSRIARAAQYYMAGNAGGEIADLRFDVVVVSGFRVWHLDNAW